MIKLVSLEDPLSNGLEWIFEKQIGSKLLFEKQIENIFTSQKPRKKNQNSEIGLFSSPKSDHNFAICHPHSMKFVLLGRYKPPLTNTVEIPTRKMAYLLCKIHNRPLLLGIHPFCINRPGDTSKSPSIEPIFGMDEFFEKSHNNQKMLRCSGQFEI